jgi:monoamine oxidase
MTPNIHDVIIIGAGASGLIAALELAQTGKKVALLEGRNRIGGRIHTLKDKDFDLPVELGAEFVHGNLEITQSLLGKAQVPYFKIKGEIWQRKEGQLQEQKDFIMDYSLLEKKFKELKYDISVAQFIKEYLPEKNQDELRFTLKNYVEGYYAADTKKASAIALCEELTQSDDEQYRIEGGYNKLMEFLYQKAEAAGCFTYLSQVVQRIKWKENHVEVITNRQTFLGKKVLITVPLGVIQAGQIVFSPAIDEKIAAAKELGFGPVIKTILQFESAFWKNKLLTRQQDLHRLGFLFSDEAIPTWWTQYPKQAAVVTGWLAGPKAERAKAFPVKDLLQKALQTLHSIFDIEISFLQQHLKGWHVANWATDPFSCGAYAYEVVNGKEFRKKLKAPLLNTLFFAGEALVDGPQIGTVEAALKSGRETAHQMIASF